MRTVSSSIFNIVRHQKSSNAADCAWTSFVFFSVWSLHVDVVLAICRTQSLFNQACSRSAYPYWLFSMSYTLLLFEQRRLFVNAALIKFDFRLLFVASFFNCNSHQAHQTLLHYLFLRQFLLRLLDNRWFKRLALGNRLVGCSSRSGKTKSTWLVVGLNSTRSKACRCGSCCCWPRA